MYASLDVRLFCTDKIETLKQLKDIYMERKPGKLYKARRQEKRDNA